MRERLPHEKGFHVSWDQLHRDARALAWRLDGEGPDAGGWRVVVAITRGSTRNRIGEIACERRALSSSLTAIVPSSAAIDAPANPTSTIAPISGPNSRNIAMPMMVGN